MALDHLKEYHRPANMAEALALLRRSSVRTVPLGGGAYLTTHSDPQIEAVVDLSSLGLDTVEEVGEEMRVGAMLRLDSVAAGALPGRAGRILAQVARLQASWQLRRGTTLGGALVTGSTVELAAILWVLDARVLLRGESARTIAFADFLAERDSLSPGTLLTGLIVPGLAAGEGAGTARVSRTPADGPIVSAAAYVRRQRDASAAVRLVVTGAAERPLRLSAVEQALATQTWSDTLLERVTGLIGGSVSPPTDMRGSREYRQAMLGVCARRALAAAWRDATG